MYTFSLDSVFTEEVSGAKAFHLAKMKRAGFTIPSGFVLTTKAFDNFYLTKTPIDEQLKADIEAALQAVGAEKYMVRSSAIGEDGAEASFAGQLDSFRSTSDINDIIEKLYQCWASYTKENVKIYEEKSGRKLRGMGVVIQELIDPDYSGVLFTLNPSDETEMLLEYVEGHGDKLVSGLVTPTSCTYSRKKHETNKEVPFDFSEGLKVAHSLEQFYQVALDIEWVIKNNQFYLVQSRPITTTALGKKVYWSNTNVNENYPEPMSPLLYSIARDSYYHYFKNLSRLFMIKEEQVRELEPAYANVIGVFGCKMYYNISSIHEIISSSPFSKILLKSFDNFVGYVKKNEDKASQKGKGKLSFLLEVWKFNRSLNKTVSEFEAMANSYHEQADSAITFNELKLCFHAFIEIRLHSWYKASLADFFAMLYHGLLGKFCGKFYGEDMAGGIHNKLIQAIPNLISSEPIILIYHLKINLRNSLVVYQKFKNSSPLEFWEWLIESSPDEEVKKEIIGYLKNWGFRCSGELMLTSKNYSEEPWKFIELLQQYDNLPESDPEKLIAQKFEERGQVIKSFKGKILKRNGILFPVSLLQIGVLNALIRLASKGIAARERVRLKQALLYFKFKQVVEKTGVEFKKKGLIENETDIFFLKHQEISENLSSSDMLAGNMKERIAQRQQEFIKCSQLEYPDDFASNLGNYPLPSEVKSNTLSTSDDGSVLKGLSVCGGIVRGRAKVLTTVLEASKLERGDILVTRQTDPGWVVVFPFIKGLIVERGGMLSHGAIVSREFGIPAIVGVEHATTKIKDGDELILNADTGEITFLN